MRSQIGWPICSGECTRRLGARASRRGVVHRRSAPPARCPQISAAAVDLGPGPHTLGRDPAPPGGSGPALRPAGRPARSRARPPRAAAEPRLPGPAGWPLAGSPEVVRGFDAPEHDYGPGHRGVDLAARPGEPVRAAVAGTVAFAGSVAGRGVVSIDHGAFRTTYEPVVARVRRRPAGRARRDHRTGGRRRALRRLPALGAAPRRDVPGPAAADPRPVRAGRCGCWRPTSGRWRPSGPGSARRRPPPQPRRVSAGWRRPSGRWVPVAGTASAGRCRGRSRPRSGCGSTRCCGAGSCTTAPTSARPAALRSGPRTPARSPRRTTAGRTDTGCCSPTARWTGTR